MKAPVLLQTGRTIIHILAPNGSSFAVPATGKVEMTDAEWKEYAATIVERNLKNRVISWSH
jgi:phage protein D